MQLKHEILAAQSESGAHELADILLKINPDKDADAVENHATKLVLVSLILSASSQGNNCVQFFMDRLKESNPNDWLSLFQGRAKTNLETVLSNMTEKYSRMLGQQLYMRIGTYVWGQCLHSNAN